MSDPAPSTESQTALLKEVLESLKALQGNQAQLASYVDAIAGRVNILAGIKEVEDVAAAKKSNGTDAGTAEAAQPKDVQSPEESPLLSSIDGSQALETSPKPVSPSKKSGGTGRIILTCVLNFSCTWR